MSILRAPLEGCSAPSARSAAKAVSVAGFDWRPPQRGEMAEWSKAHAWKVCRRVTVSRVRIPFSPPATQFLHEFQIVLPFQWLAKSSVVHKGGTHGLDDGTSLEASEDRILLVSSARAR